MIGLGIFGFAFAVISSLHSYLILAYAGSKKAAEDVGFYYAANAGGRLFGIVLSGVLTQIGRLAGLPVGLGRHAGAVSCARVPAAVGNCAASHGRGAGRVGADAAEIISTICEMIH